ncbi:MAG: hypothetical protein E7614_06965 [Ruminococcaceae bacterium]|nr:hypothetical protein [Oscillospiraceae bacterium]
MKKILFLILILIVIFPISAKAESVPLFQLKDETVEFSPHGYMPAAESEYKEILPLISYFAVDTKTSAPVSLPLKAPGTYQIFASFDGNGKYDKFEASCTVTIIPIEAKIVVLYDTVAYSKLENPVEYTVEPQWAEDFLNIKTEYYPIETESSLPDKKIHAPVDLGTYYTVFNVTSETEGVICENKYMIYKIAPYRGKKLSSEESRASVPKSFVCNFHRLNTVYEKDKPISVSYSLYPAAISGKILYRKVYSNGTFSEYFEETPIEPGEYSCGYFLGSVCIGEGNIFIDKREAIITIENETVEYTQGGIIPSGKCENEDIEIAFTAFVVDENGNVTMEEASVPIKKCGKYSIIAYPKDTLHYKRTYAYGFIEILPSTPEINVTETEFICDGAEKHIGVEVTPAEVKYSVDYFEWEDRESNVPLGSAPTRAGKYLVVITTYDENENYNVVTKSTVMYIDEVIPPKPHSSLLEKILLCILGAFVSGGIVVGVLMWKKAKA